MPLDSGPLARIGRAYPADPARSREYPYAVQAPRRRPWSRAAAQLPALALACGIASGLAWALVNWWSG